MTKKRVGLVGYYGYGNYGDELFRSVFEKIFYDCELVILQDNQSRPYYGDDIAERIASVDCLLIGGGDLVIGNYWTDQYFEKAFLEKPIYIHGVGVPTWSGEKADVVARLAEFFQHPSVRYINVRDRESGAWMSKNLSPTVPIELSADMVCALDLKKTAATGEPPVFGLVTRKQKAGEIHWANVAALCDKARDLGYRVKNIVLGTDGDRRDDLAGLQEFDYPEMETVGSEDLEALTLEIGSCDVIASMKFHGCVVSTMYGIPAIAMITTDKFRNFYDRIERRDLIAHHTHVDLPDRLPRFMAPIPKTTRQHLRQDALRGLARLRGLMLDEIA